MGMKAHDCCYPSDEGHFRLSLIQPPTTDLVKQERILLTHVPVYDTTDTTIRNLSNVLHVQGFVQFGEKTWGPFHDKTKEWITMQVAWNFLQMHTSILRGLAKHQGQTSLHELGTVSSSSRTWSTKDFSDGSSSVPLEEAPGKVVQVVRSGSHMVFVLKRGDTISGIYYHLHTDYNSIRALNMR
jgi:hypothetical protein